MRPILGFSDRGHLGDVTARAAEAKGFPVSNEIKECDIVFISPDRPGDVSPEQAVARILPHLKPRAILVVLCQVDPCFTRKIKLDDTRLYYLVETLKVNHEAMERALHPERLIVGTATPVTDMDIRLVEYLSAFECPIIRMSYESAELAKIAINIYLAAQVETTNRLARVARKVSADWGDVTLALKTDKRIGQYAYLKPGSGFGPHLQRDVDTIWGLMDHP